MNLISKPTSSAHQFSFFQPNQTLNSESPHAHSFYTKHTFTHCVYYVKPTFTQQLKMLRTEKKNAPQIGYKHVQVQEIGSVTILTRQIKRKNSRTSSPFSVPRSITRFNQLGELNLRCSGLNYSCNGA